MQNLKIRQVKVLYVLAEFAYLRHLRGMEQHSKTHEMTSLLTLQHQELNYFVLYIVKFDYITAKSILLDA